jgi:fluoride exporter
VSPFMMLMVAAGGALGAVLRALVGAGVGRLLGGGFPYATMTVNVAGSLTMGLLVGGFALYFSPSPELRAFLTVGFLGGFTTFSSFSLDVATLVERQQAGLALLYIALSVGVSLMAIFAGLRLARWMWA